MKLLGFLISIVILGTVSLIDDVKDIRAWIKLVTQIICASLIYIFGVRISDIGGTVLNPVVSYFLTTAWIIGITNAINLIDGLDGLSSGITLISSLSLLIIFATNDSSTLSMILITALAGGIVGFLPFNINPAKTFIGDVGSQFYGFSLAVISIFGVAKTVTVAVLIGPILILALPIIDTLFAIVRRTVKGKSIKAIFQADKGHLHHRLMKRGFTQKQAVTILYGISASFGMFVVILIYEGIIKALAFLGVTLIIVIIGFKGVKKYQEDLIKENKELGLVNIEEDKNEKGKEKQSKTNKEKRD